MPEGCRRGVALFAVAVWIGVGPLAARALDRRPETQDVLRATLANGLRVVAVRSPVAPVVTAVVNYGVGANESPPGLPGMAHAAEHMMFRGSPGLSAEQLAEVAAGVGGHFNAVTRPTVTQYFFTVPAEDLNVVLHLESLRMRGVLDSREGWERERRAILQEVAQQLSNPEYVLYQKALASLFEGSAYARDVLGTRESFERMTPAMVRAFHATWYVPNNAILVIAGDIEPARVLEDVRTHFGDVPAREIPPRKTLELRPLKPASVDVGTNEPHGLATFWFRMPGIESRDFAAAAVLARALGSHSGPLQAPVSEGRALSARFSLEALPGASIASVRVTFPKDADASPIREEIQRILSEVHRRGVLRSPVEAAKRRLILDAEIERSSVPGLALAWSRAVAVAGRRSPQEEVDAIGKVTVEDVARLAGERLDPDRAVVGLLAESGARADSSAPSAETGELPAPETTSPVALPDWAAEALQAPVHPAPLPDAPPTSFPNGLQLIVRSLPVDTRAVFVLGKIDTGLGLEPPEGQEGVGEVLNGVFASGTASLDRSAFHRALDEIGALESMGTDFSLRVLRENLDQGVELLAGHLLQPRLTEEAFRRAQQNVAATVAGRVASPDYRASRALRVALLPPGDPGLRETTPETVGSLSLADVRAHYERTFRPTRTTIVVVGDVEAGSVRKLFEKHFRKWRGAGLDEYVFRPPLPANEASMTTIPDASRVQSSVTLAQTLGLGRSHPDYYALELGNHVLSSALNASRLYRALRERSGLVYRLSSELIVRSERSFYAVNFACDPANVARARAIALGELERMREEPVSTGELERARSLLLRGMLLSESGVEGIARSVLHRVAQGLPLDEPRKAARRYSALTAEQVRAAFSSWIRPDGLATVVHGATFDHPGR